MCGLEFSDLETSVWQAYRDAGLVLIGINTGGLGGGDSAAVVRRFLAQTGATFPVGWDANQSYRSWGFGTSISPFPVDVIIDPQGRIAYLANEYDAAPMQETLRSLLGQ